MSTRPRGSGARVQRMQPQDGLLTESEWHHLLQIELDLSARMAQVVRAIFDDLRDEEIGAALGIRKSTVHTYVGRLYRRFGVSNRAALVVAVMTEYFSRRT